MTFGKLTDFDWIIRTKRGSVVVSGICSPCPNLVNQKWQVCRGEKN